MKIDFEQVKSDAVGKWLGIFNHMGINVGNGKHCACPACGGKDRFRCDDKDGKGTWICGQCGAGDGFTLLMKVLNADFKQVAISVAGIVGTVEKLPFQEEKPVSPQRLRQMFIESERIVSTDIVSLYLKNRNLNSLPVGLRCHMKCYEPETQEEQVAMLAIFSDKENQAVTLHRTYLNQHGYKLDIKSPKKMMPPLKKMSGGAVRLYEYKSEILGVCEGIETAIAIHDEAKIPVWAALSSILLEKFEPPKNIKEIIVFGDNDKNFTGQKSAYALAHRLSIEGFPVSVEIPVKLGTDFLDEFTGN